MKEITAELAITGAQLDLNLHLQVDDRRTEELVGPEGVVEEVGVAICGAWCSMILIKACNHKLMLLFTYRQIIVHTPYVNTLLYHSLIECPKRTSPIPQPLWPTRSSFDANTFIEQEVSFLDWHYSCHVLDSNNQTPQRYLCWWSRKWGGHEWICGRFQCTSQTPNNLGKCYVVDTNENAYCLGYYGRQPSSWQLMPSS